MRTKYKVIFYVVVIIIVIIVAIPSLAQMSYYAGVQDRTSKLIAQYGGQGIVDKFGTICTTTTHQMWDNTCNFDLSPTRQDWESQPNQNTETIIGIPAQLTSQEWKEYQTKAYIELDSFKNLHKFDPEKYCDLFQEKIKEIGGLEYEGSQLIMDYNNAYKYANCEES